MSSLGARLLEGPSNDAATAPCGRRWVQRIASWQGPDPSLALIFVLALAGCACLAERRQAKVRAPAVTNLAATNAGGLGLGGEEAAGQPGPVLAALLATALGAIICQYVSEKLAINVVAETFRGMRQFGISLERRSIRAWICPGRLSLRNCILQNPEGYRGSYLLLVRGITADVGVWHLLRSLGTDIRIQKLSLQDVDIVLEEGSGRPAISNLEVMLEALKDHEKSQPRTGCRFHVGQVAIKNVGVQVGVHRTPLADLSFDDFGAASGARSARGAAAALAAALARAALEGRAQAAASGAATAGS